MWIRVSTLRRNVAANFVGRIWTTVLALAFIPLYLQFLGVEAYGLVGFFATLQGVFGVLDLGIGATVNRELARLAAVDDRREEQRSLVRTLELCYWVISVGSGGFVLVLAPTIAHDWVQVSELSAQTVERAIRVMGLVIALQMPFSFYQSALMGLQRQVALNAIVMAVTTARTVGTVLVLWKISPSVEAFFLCQLAGSLAQTVSALATVWSGLGGGVGARPQFTRVVPIWRYAAATSANAIVGVALTQTDKVLLSRLLSLEQFGYYALAGTIASFVWAAAIPVNQALFPRFAELVELGDEVTLSGLYHRASQIMVVTLIPAAATVAFFSWPLLAIWTRNPLTADHAALVASLLIAGTAINGLVSVPGYLQAAAGWPALMVYTNAAAAVVLVPAILVMTPRYGAAGAALVWLILNTGYLMFNVPVMHRRLLRGEQSRWYLEDLGLPVAGTLAVVVSGRLLMPDMQSMWMTASWIAAVGLIALGVCATLAPQVRAILSSGLALVRI